MNQVSSESFEFLFRRKFQKGTQPWNSDKKALNQHRELVKYQPYFGIAILVKCINLAIS